MESASSMRAHLTDDNIAFTRGNCSICQMKDFQICLHYRIFFYCMNCIPPLQTVHTYCLSSNSVCKPRCYELGTSLQKQLDSVIQSQHHCVQQLPLLLQQMFMASSSSAHILLVDLILQTKLSMYFPCNSKLFAGFFCQVTHCARGFCWWWFCCLKSHNEWLPFHVILQNSPKLNRNYRCQHTDLTQKSTCACVYVKTGRCFEILVTKSE